MASRPHSTGSQTTRSNRVFKHHISKLRAQKCIARLEQGFNEASNGTTETRDVASDRASDFKPASRLVPSSSLMWPSFPTTLQFMLYGHHSPSRHGTVPPKKQCHRWRHIFSHTPHPLHFWRCSVLCTHSRRDR